MILLVARWWHGEAGFGETSLGLLVAMPFVFVGFWALRVHERFAWGRNLSEVWFAGSLAVLMGVILIAAMTQSPASAFHVPRWAAYVAAALFPLAGVIVIVSSAVNPADSGVVRVLVAVLVTALAVVGWVVAFSASDVTVTGSGVGTAPAGPVGNVVFGIGAAIVSVIAGWLWVTTIRWFGVRRRGGAQG